jgi:ABC-type Zn uptake system ZnuABC Zn-binding protein ZnuA
MGASPPGRRSIPSRLAGLDVVGTIEPKPGISPSPAHIAELIEIMKRDKVKIVIRTSYFEARTPELVAKSTGATNLVLPYSVGAVIFRLKCFVRPWSFHN